MKIYKYSGLEFFFWATCACYYPFLVVFLGEKGYNNTTIGVFLAINSFVVVMAQPFWGMVSDWVQSVKKVFIICVAGAIVLIQSLPFYQSVFLIGLTLAMVTFFESGLMPLLDSWVIRGIKTDQNIAYGNVRLWGSIGFAIVVYIMGNIITFTSINAMFIGYGILGLATILTCLTIENDKPAASTSLKNLKVGRLLSNYHYITFIIFATIISIPHRSSSFFGLSGIIGSYGGGWVIDNLGLMSMYYIGGYMSIIVSILFIVSLWLKPLGIKHKGAREKGNCSI